MLQAQINKNDKLAYSIIGVLSVVVFLVVASLPKIHNLVAIPVSFDPHIFALVNAVLNSAVTLLLIAGVVLIKQKKYTAHKNVMLAAIVISALFLVSYIAHHLLAGDTTFGGTGFARYIYFPMLISHIILAAIILPFILYTAYQSLSGQFEKHKKIVRYTFPLWLYVSITGVLVYVMIAPYYS